MMGRSPSLRSARQTSNPSIQEAQSRPQRVKPVEQPKVDPIQMMFKMFKNNYPVKLSVLIEENIPNPTFIGMVQENVEADAIEYYANKILNNLLKDPSKLKTEIYNQLKNSMNKGPKSRNSKSN